MAISGDNQWHPRSEPLETRAVAALRAAVGIIRTWHNLRFQGNFGPVSATDSRRAAAGECWRIYYLHSPEMAPIRELLGPEPPEEDEHADPS